MFDVIPWATAGLVTGGIIHLLTVFGIPWLAENDAWNRLKSQMPSNTLAVYDEKSKFSLPFASPDVVHAYCLFDISERNVVVTSPLQDGPWSIAVSTRSGENFYVITGADAKKSEIRIIIIPRDRLAQEASTEKTEEGEDQNIIVSPTATGIVAIRAPLRGESFRVPTVEALNQARCEVQKPQEALIAAAASAEAPEAQAAPRLTRRLRRDRRRRRQ